MRPVFLCSFLISNRDIQNLLWQFSAYFIVKLEKNVYN